MDIRKEMNREKDIKRMKELMAPIDQQILMCDDRNDLLMMASAMMITAKNIFEDQIGVEGRIKMFKDFIK
ncbi:MAG: hypothetical protein EBX47_12070 [Synechococcaceae bacterium WB8_1B_057]|nr:hypothetical protein [Synechococcaceae bacterium WB6_1A_059]NDG80133.1 hypothetical protein [Synechococcaceae bacterium WB8_1B_057]